LNLTEGTQLMGDIPAAPEGLRAGQMLPAVDDVHGGVIGAGHVLTLKSPARRSRAGLGVDGVAGMVSLSR
jgi:hypothetical protein